MWSIILGIAFVVGIVADIGALLTSVIGFVLAIFCAAGDNGSGSGRRVRARTYRKNFCPHGYEYFGCQPDCPLYEHCWGEKREGE